MPIIDLQRRLAEVGRLRIGQQVSTANGKTRPVKLDTWRLTSPDRNRIGAAARLYGGTINKWQAPPGPQWEVITTTDTLPVIVPPSDLAFSQNYELWGLGGCQRRCDGRTETITDAPCLCDPDNRECDIHTRLSVMLRDLPGLGVWRIDTQGYHAAVELQGAVEIINMAAGRGQMLPATLRLEQRMTKRPDQGTRRFAVPVLDIEVSPGQLIAGTIDLTPCQDERAAIPAPPLTPVPAADTISRPSIAAQVTVADSITRKRRGSVSIPATGLAPRTAAQVASDTPQTAGAAPPAAEPEVLVDQPVHAAPAPGGQTADKSGTGTAEQSAPPPPGPDQPDPPITKPQRGKLFALMADAGLKEREDYLAVIAHILGYRIETSNNLTKSEAIRLIDTLETWTVASDYPIADRINDILNTAALTEAEQEGSDDGL